MSSATAALWHYSLSLLVNLTGTSIYGCSALLILFVILLRHHIRRFVEGLHKFWETVHGAGAFACIHTDKITQTMCIACNNQPNEIILLLNEIVENQ